MSEYIVRMPPDMPYEIRAELNAWYVESEPIVRCRDCRFSLAHGNGCGRNQDIYDAEPDGFCAWAERRVDDAD